MGVDFEVVLDRFSFLEGPRWRSGRLWASDFYTSQVISCLADGSDLRMEATTPGRPSGLGWLPDGRLLVVSMDDRKVLRRESTGAMVVHADLAAYAVGSPNDMLVDSLGRAFVGCFGFDLDSGDPVAPAPLLRVDPDGAVSVSASGLHFPNGAVLMNGTLVVAETTGNRISAFDVGADGQLGGRRDWAIFGDIPSAVDFGEVVAQLDVAPDGMCADSEGALWVADALGNRVLRVRPGGEIVGEIDAGTGVYACALGGQDGRTLFLCTAPSFLAHERINTRDARILAVKVEVPA